MDISSMPSFPPIKVGDRQLSDMELSDMDIYGEFCFTELLYIEESVWGYQPGGYHPVAIGDSFKDGRYEVYHKLGHGYHSTVWLARDKSIHIWVALKILEANATHREMSNFDLFSKQTNYDPSSYHVVQALDIFFHKGPNGSHQCFILELLGPTLHHMLRKHLYQGGPWLSLSTIRRISGQLMKAVKFIHEVGTKHGDINCNDIGFTCPHLWYLPEEAFFKVIGTPRVVPIERLDGRPLPYGWPTHLIESATWPGGIDMDIADIRLFDFGGSPCQIGDRTRADLPIPEQIFTGMHDFRADLWLAGYAMYTMLYAKQPYGYHCKDHPVVQMINLVGELPDEWKPKWEEIKEKSDKDCDAQIKPGPSEIEAELSKAEDLSVLPCVTAIEGLMRFLPSSRISPEETIAILQRPRTSTPGSSEPVNRRGGTRSTQTMRSASRATTRTTQTAQTAQTSEHNSDTPE